MCIYNHIAKAKLEYKQKPQEREAKKSQERPKPQTAHKLQKPQKPVRPRKPRKKQNKTPRSTEQQTFEKRWKSNACDYTTTVCSCPENQGRSCNCLCAVVTSCKHNQLESFLSCLLCVGTTVQVRWGALSDWPADSSIGNRPHQIRQGTKRHRKCMQDSKQGRDWKKVHSRCQCKQRHHLPAVST